MLSKEQVKRLEDRIQAVFWELYVAASRDQHLTFEWEDFKSSLTPIIPPSDTGGWEIARNVWWKPENRRKYHERKSPFENFKITNDRLHKAVFTLNEGKEYNYKVTWVLIH